MTPLQEKIRKYDYDRFIGTLFAEPGRQEDLLNLYSFNLEIAKIKEITSEPMMGLIRLQWWRDAIEEIYSGNPRSHEVVNALEPIVKKFSLSKDLFLKILDGREKDLDEVPVSDVSDLLSYVKNTSAVLLELATEILEIKEEKCKSAIENIGVAWGLTGILRAFRFNMASGKHFLPVDMLQGKDSSPSSEDLRTIVRDISGLANNHLSAACAGVKLLDKKTRKKLKPISSLLIFADIYLRRIKKFDYEILTNDIEQPKFPMLLKVWIS